MPEETPEQPNPSQPEDEQNQKVKPLPSTSDYLVHMQEDWKKENERRLQAERERGEPHTLNTPDESEKPPESPTNS